MTWKRARNEDECEKKSRSLEIAIEHCQAHVIHRRTDDDRVQIGPTISNKTVPPSYILLEHIHFS